MLELKIGDRVRSREDGMVDTVARREHDHYVIDWDDGESEVYPDDADLGARLQLWPKHGLTVTPDKKARG
jgi:hypothetical protein